MPAWTGIAACALAFLLALFALAMYVWEWRGDAAAALKGWSVWLIVAVVLMAFALLWGNVGVIFSNAGFTG